jgi:uncharacterized protein YdaU (DUF1376 family)
MTKCSPLSWFRLYAEFSSDPKVQIMPEPMQRRLVMLFCLRCSEALPTLNDDEIAFALRISAEELAETKALFLRKGFIDETWSLLNWNKRQFASDCSTERVRKHRQRQAEQASQQSETFRNCSMKRNETRQETSVKQDTKPGESDTERGKTTKTGPEDIEKPDETIQKRSGNVIEQRREEQNREREHFSPPADAPANGSPSSLSPAEDQTFEEPCAAQEAQGREIPVKPPAKAEPVTETKEKSVPLVATGTDGPVTNKRVVQVPVPRQVPFRVQSFQAEGPPEALAWATGVCRRHPRDQVKDLERTRQALIDRFWQDPVTREIFDSNHKLDCQRWAQNPGMRVPWLWNAANGGYIGDGTWTSSPVAGNGAAPRRRGLKAGEIE